MRVHAHPYSSHHNFVSICLWRYKFRHGIFPLNFNINLKHKQNTRKHNISIVLKTLSLRPSFGPKWQNINPIFIFKLVIYDSKPKTIYGLRYGKKAKGCHIFAEDISENTLLGPKYVLTLNFTHVSEGFYTCFI